MGFFKKIGENLDMLSDKVSEKAGELVDKGKEIGSDIADNMKDKFTKDDASSDDDVVNR